MHDEAVTKTAWLPSQPLVVATTADGCAHVWDARDGRSVAVLTGHAGIIVDVAVGTTPGGVRVVTAGDDHVCRVYAVVDGRAHTTT